MPAPATKLCTKSESAHSWTLGHLFPAMPGQSGYNKRLRRLAGEICLVLKALARASPSFSDGVRLLDSTPVP